MTIMGIDDSITMRKIIHMAVQDLGDFIEAENGQDALEKLKGRPRIDYFVVDVNMPRMNGIQFIKEVRRIPEYVDTPIVVITTESDQGMVDEGMKAGAQAWLLKPFEKEALLKILKK